MSSAKDNLLFSLIVDLRQASKRYRLETGKARDAAKRDYDSKLTAIIQYIKNLLKGAGDNDDALTEAARGVVTKLLGVAGPQGAKVFTHPFTPKTSAQELASANPAGNGNHVSDALETRAALIVERCQGIDHSAFF